MLGNNGQNATYIVHCITKLHVVMIIIACGYEQNCMWL